MKTSILLFLFLIFQSCASVSKKNPEINLNKELKNGTISFVEYSSKIKTNKPSYSDSLALKGRSKPIELDVKSVEFLKLNSIDAKAKKFYFLQKIELSENFISIVVSSKKAEKNSTYLINYNADYQIIDNLLIFLDYNDNNFSLSSQLYKDKISTNEIFIDQGQAIIQSWGRKINDNGTFSR